MAFTHGVLYRWTDGNQTLSGNTAEQTNQGEISQDVTITAGASNIEVSVAFTVAQVKSVFILSDEAVSLETNSSSAAQETIALQADLPLVWQTGGYMAIPFAGNVTKFFFTNAGASDANINIRILIDATP